MGLEVVRDRGAGLRAMKLQRTMTPEEEAEWERRLAAGEFLKGYDPAKPAWPDIGDECAWPEYDCPRHGPRTEGEMTTITQGQDD